LLQKYLDGYRVDDMGILTDNGVSAVHHYTPLHYLPFIARSGTLLGKPALAAAGFAASHLRSMSSPHDIARGFGEYGFLTLDESPRILAAKLSAGFPHIGILVPAESIEATAFALCRFNVAMTRFLRRGNKSGFDESSTNGRYYGKKQIPVAVDDDDKTAMLQRYVGSNTMIEVLLSDGLPLPANTTVICYSEPDAAIAEGVLGQLGRDWSVKTEQPLGEYHRRQDYVKDVQDFIAHALADTEWRGNGLEFDRV
jgi:hypothetical protein